ncbi:LysR family transcriptional regulator [Halioxenophilus aromaticivorans]|uniref:LysR family transcriptional regulator n=1 Tax=Halioxenophilus aromaticivorans TaxID=1306992 RepID=A0AAV3U7H4_9ALTE
MALQNISLKQLRYFAAAAEHGRLAMAAAHIHVSQSTITSAILQLEATLKTQLFIRQSHGVSLTAEGSRFYSRIRDILNSLEDTLSDTSLPSEQIDGMINVGASYTLLGYFLPALMGRFRARHPAIKFNLLDMAREKIEHAIISGELDLGIVLLSNSQNLERFKYTRLLESPRKLWTSVDHPLLSESRLTLDKIRQYSYIQITVDEGERSTLRYWQQHNLKPNIGFRTSSMEALRGLIAHGFGVTILSDMVYRPWSLESKKIEAVQIIEPIANMEIGLIWRHDAELTQAADIFKTFLIDTCNVD